MTLFKEMTYLVKYTNLTYVSQITIKYTYVQIYKHTYKEVPQLI